MGGECDFVGCRKRGDALVFDLMGLRVGYCVTHARYGKSLWARKKLLSMGSEIWTRREHGLPKKDMHEVWKRLRDGRELCVDVGEDLKQ